MNEYEKICIAGLNRRAGYATANDFKNIHAKSNQEYSCH